MCEYEHISRRRKGDGIAQGVTLTETVVPCTGIVRHSGEALDVRPFCERADESLWNPAESETWRAEP